MLYARYVDYFLLIANKQIKHVKSADVDVDGAKGVCARSLIPSTEYPFRIGKRTTITDKYVGSIKLPPTCNKAC